MNAPKPHGFSLVEVCLALGIVAFCILPLVGLLSVGLNSNHVSVEQTAATEIASAIRADLALVPSAAASKSPQFQLANPFAATAANPSLATLYLNEDATLASDAGSARYRGTVVVLKDANSSFANGTGNYWVRIVVSWPAAIDPIVNRSGAVMVEITTAINRNGK